ncbi:MAG: spore germination protein GerPB [Bacillota bacterium]|nr:spore germination protein GerPB [Bacillota bacterium]MDP4171495.1 spore germination protein GerPB [Bacillota bacterium]
MNFYIQQSIQINFIKIGSVSNSSVFQIGSAGIINQASNLYNTGGFTKPAPAPAKPGVGPVEQKPSGNGAVKKVSEPSPLKKAPAVPFK